MTTSYPRGPEDVAGAFVRDAVEHLQEAGLDVEVVSPASFRHFGLAYGHGIVGNLRRRPWLVAFLPLFLASYASAGRRAARDADLVHAHWLPSALPALATGKPFVLQLWGTDAALARRVPWPFRWLVRRAKLVLCGSRALAADAEALGARDVRVVASGVEVPDRVGEPVDPAHVLYVGRLSEEKGVRELAAATDGIPRVVVGDGPLRALFPDAVGFVEPGRLGPYYERASVVACPSHREGYGVVAREAMAYGRPVVASAVGGLVDAVEDGVSGLLVPPGDSEALRDAIEHLLGDAQLRARLGEAARAKARGSWSPAAARDATIGAYREALGAAASAVPQTLVEALALQERAWKERPLLRRLYGEWFQAIAARMSSVQGLSVELGSGIGRLREVYPDIVTTDVEPTPWTGRVADAADLPYGGGEVANLVLVDVFHHLARPARFLDEVVRVLAPGGRVIVLDPYCSPVSTRLYSQFHHERTDLDAEPFADDASIATEPLASNQARATLAFFRGSAELAARWPQLALVERRRLALLAYPLSGGFSRRRLVPDTLGRALLRAEGALGWAAPWLAFRCLVVLERRD